MNAPHFGRFVACELIHYHKAAMASITEQEVVSLGQGIKSWSDVDIFACYIAGPAWLSGQLKDATIRSWAHSADRWWRRAALVSTVPLNAAKQPQAASIRKTLAICALLVSDRDDMVVKALSWALRKAAARHLNSVRKLLAEQNRKTAPRVLRQVQNKLTTGLKNPAAQLRRTKS